VCVAVLLLPAFQTITVHVWKASIMVTHMI